MSCAIGAQGTCRSYPVCEGCNANGTAEQYVERCVAQALEREHAKARALEAALREVVERASAPVATTATGGHITAGQVSAAITRCVQLALEYASAPARAALEGRGSL